MNHSEQKEVEIAIEGSKELLNKMIDYKRGDLLNEQTLKMSKKVDDLINHYMNIKKSDSNKE